MKNCKIAIIDDHLVFREGLKLLVEKTEEGKVCYEAENGQQFIEKLAKKKVDIAFMDIEMPIMNGIEATAEALKICPDLKIIALTTFEDEENLQKMLIAGVNGYMLKSSSYAEFKEAILKIKEGNHFFSNKILGNITHTLLKPKNKPAKKTILPSFSKREKEILELICKGFSNKRIGEILHISDRTVEKHKTNLLQKTETENTVNLVIYCFRNKIIES